MEFIQQNWTILLLLVILFLVILYGVNNALSSIFKGVELSNKILFILSFIGFLGQIILFKQKCFEIGINATLIVSIILFWLFINRQKIENEEFNAFVTMLFVGQSAYCMIASNQKELYDYEIFYNIVYAGIYIGIPMFIAYKFTSEEKEVSNKEDIYTKLKGIEKELNNINSSITKSYKYSNFRRFNRKRKNK
ncbi:hypothetical protein [Mannheimia pernigra]|uniref:Uncharacterized protein n=1 Tax=Mannheimia pernigra TaxID=111844 RepID=A0A7D5DWS5_9PAST|nr:hypothetical protein [Mannheimia pernigra]QLB40099.1 hypothetical protein HV559_03990 [Mannheimia pernigra]